MVNVETSGANRVREHVAEGDPRLGYWITLLFNGAVWGSAVLLMWPS